MRGGGGLDKQTGLECEKHNKKKQKRKKTNDKLAERQRKGTDTKIALEITWEREKGTRKVRKKKKN